MKAQHTFPYAGGSGVASSLANAGSPVWDDGDWAPLPALEASVDCDVCVVGLGGSGLACIGELVVAGVRVVGLDGVGVGAGAAGRNGGFLLAGIADFHHDAVRAHGRERAARWYRLTLDTIARMREETPGAVDLRGSLRVADAADEEGDIREHLRALQDDGFAGEWYEGPEGRGIRIPGDGILDPLRRVRTLARQACAAGATLFERSPVVAMGSDGVETPHGRVRARRVIVAVDGRLESLLPELAGRVRSARFQMLATAPAPEVSFPLPVYTRFAWDYWQQLPGGEVALGGCRDVGGDAEWTQDALVTGTVQQALDVRLRDRLGVRAEVTHRWAAIVSFTDTGLPIMEEVRPHVWAVGAYCGTGNVLGAFCGRHAARLAMGRTTEPVFR